MRLGHAHAPSSPKPAHQAHQAGDPYGDGVSECGANSRDSAEPVEALLAHLLSQSAARIRDMSLPTSVVNLWAKTGADGAWHPLILHCLDVAAAAGALLEREPPTSRERLSGVLALPWAQAQPWLLLLVAAHDVGKACPGFQCKWKNFSGLDTPKLPDTAVNHAFVTQIALAEWLKTLGWPIELADRSADAVGCHHGKRASAITLERVEGSRRALGDHAWREIRAQILGLLRDVLRPQLPPSKADMTGPEFIWLAGLTSFADWIGSNVDWFPFGTPNEAADLPGWFAQRLDGARRALDAIGWAERRPLISEPCDFAAAFGLSPRPLQSAMVDALGSIVAPPVLLIEAPMGEGKTEAAWYAHLELQRRFGHRGLYVAMPTQATGNAMFERTRTFLQARAPGRLVDLQLVHGGSALSDAFRALRFAPVYDDDAPVTQGDSARVRAAEWFTHKKRALLSEYGVGTVDQALLPALPVRHHFVRLWGLANRVVVFDEIHAYDAYTGTLLLHLVAWLQALGSSIVLLSATLPPFFRRSLARHLGAAPPDRAVDYPRLTTIASGQVVQRHFPADPSRRLRLRIHPVAAELPALCEAVKRGLNGGGMGMVLLNTVQRAQDLYRLLPGGEPLMESGSCVGKRLPDGTEVYLFHARLPADDRQRREQRVLATFGKADDHSTARRGRKILIATQVAEQSLDLDFDLIATDLAPVDLLLQRAGRLWRHARAVRPLPEPLLLVAGLDGDTPRDFSRPLWWNKVYAEARLLQTWYLLRQEELGCCTLPDDIDSWVSQVYEDRVTIPVECRERYERADCEAQGDRCARMGLANQQIIGLPDDDSWATNTHTMYDEDDPMVHRTLAVQTRLGEESLTIVPLDPGDAIDPLGAPAPALARRLCARALQVSRKGVVRQLKALGVPPGWQLSPWLRNSFALCLDERGAWVADSSVRLDPALGLVYESSPTTEEPA